MSAESLDARDALRELADRWELVASLEDPPGGDGGTGVGPRVPPGVGAMLTADEVRSALAEVDDWAGYCVSVVASDLGELDVPALTPARLRWLSERADVLLEQDDEVLARAFVRELARYLEQMRRLSTRGLRTVRTGMACDDPTCSGHLISRPDDGDPSALVCDRCLRVVPWVVWSSWPRAGLQFVTVEHAARLLGTTVAAVKKRASRFGWRRTGTGRDVRYRLADVRGLDRGA